MEITKQNETFNLKDSTEMFEINGNVSRDVSGSINIHFSINKSNGEHIGDCHYNKYSENSNINFGVNCSEANRDEVTEYADGIVDAVLSHFNITE